MKRCLLYNKDSVLRELSDFHLVDVKVHEYDEEYGDSITDQVRLTNQAEIVSFKTSWGFGRSDTVEFKDTEGNILIAESIKYVNKEVIKVKDIISPKIKIVDEEYIERTSELVDWLTYNGVDVDKLDGEAKEVTLYDTIEYIGVNDVSISGKYWSYSSENLVLDEREINLVLNGIEDKLLRKKIESILYARVFKRHR